MASHGIDAGDIGGDASPISEHGITRGMMISIACFTATLASALIYDVLPPIMGDLTKHFGGGEHGAFVAQLAGTLPLFGVMAGGLGAGWFIERTSLRTALLLTMLVFGVSGSSGVLIDREVPFLLCRLLMGVAVGVMTTACNAMVALYFRGAPRARMNGLIVGSGAIGGIVFVLIAGLTASWWWRGPFLLHGAVVLAFLVPVLASGQIKAAPLAAENPLTNLKRLRPIAPACATGFAWFVLMLMAGVKSPFVMATVGVTSHATIGMIYAINAAAVTIAAFLFGNFVPRYSPVLVIRLSFLASAAGFCLLATGQGVPQFIAAVTVNGASIGVCVTALWTWGMRAAPRDLAARALGTMTTVLYLGGAMMPILTAPYERLFGVRGQFLAVAATVVVVVAILWVMQPKRLGEPEAAL